VSTVYKTDQLIVYPCDFVDKIPKELIDGQRARGRWQWLRDIVRGMPDESVLRVQCPNKREAGLARDSLSNADAGSLRALATRTGPVDHLDGAYYLYVLKYDMLD
jgi:hypothetical protein